MGFHDLARGGRFHLSWVDPEGNTYTTAVATQSEARDIAHAMQKNWPRLVTIEDTWSGELERIGPTRGG